MLVRFLLANMIKSQAQGAVRNKVEEVVSDQVRNLEEMKQGREMPPCDVALVFANHLEATGVLDQMENVVSTQCASFVEHAGSVERPGCGGNRSRGNMASNCKGRYRSD